MLMLFIIITRFLPAHFNLVEVLRVFLDNQKEKEMRGFATLIFRFSI